MSIFDKLFAGLGKTRKAMGSQLDSVFESSRRIDSDFYDELEEVLITADVGMETTMRVVDDLRVRLKEKRIKKTDEASAELKDILSGILSSEKQALNIKTKPSVILVIGVNGVGKTTTIGKLAAMLTAQGKKILLCAGDTFRAAASEQLSIWANRSGSDIVRHTEGADPAAVLFDAVAAAKARGSDVIICDTAGRLHNKQNLMNELAKMSKIIDRELPGADRETLLVLDATTGQNGLVQAKQFKDSAGLTGVVLTKLDGTAKGGIVVAIAEELDVPVKYVGVGEGVDDLIEFDPKNFVNALFEV